MTLAPRSRVALCSCLALAVLVQSPARAGTTLAERLGNQGKVAAWAGLVRGVGQGATGLALIKSSDPELVLDEQCLERLAQEVGALIGTRDVIMPIGGLESARRESLVELYLALLERDGGRGWRSVVERQALRMASLPGGAERVYWQIGNEINSKHYSLALRRVTGAAGTRPSGSRPSRKEARRQDRPERKAQRQESGRAGVTCDGAEKALDSEEDERYAGGGDRNDPAVIAWYAEKLLAPSAAGIRSASRRAFGREDRIKVILGTLANSGTPAAQEWLKTLLDYQLTGEFAPELARMRVRDIVDIIAVHYLVSRPGDEWRKTLGDMRGRWLGQSRITGIWSTEELGRQRALQDLGGATALRVAFRYVDWWQETGLAPRQGRVNFYSAELGKPGTTADFALGMLSEFLGTAQVQALSSRSIRWSASNLETYAIAADDGRLAVVAFPAGTERMRPGRLTVTGVGPAQAGKVQAHLFEARGHSVLPVNSEPAANDVRIDFAELTVDPDATLLLLIEPGR